MAQVHINNIIVHNNPTSILSPFQFQITFQCFKHLPGNFDWRFVYLGSPTNSNYDQIIDQFDMNEIQAGVMTFNTDSNPPDFSKIPQQDILGTTAIVISVSYEGQQFFRVGYYIINQYEDNGMQIPPQPDFNRITRRIVAENPRIMRFEIQWNKHQGDSGFNEQLLQKNIEVIGGDPFLSENKNLQKIDKINYSYGMFGPGAQ